MKDKDMQDIIDRIFSLYNGMTVTEIAEKIGKSRALLQGWKQGKSKPRLEHILEIAKDTGCSLDWLLTGKDTEGKSVLRELSDSRRLRLDDGIEHALDHLEEVKNGLLEIQAAVHCSDEEQEQYEAQLMRLARARRISSQNGA